MAEKKEVANEELLKAIKEQAAKKIQTELDGIKDMSHEELIRYAAATRIYLEMNQEQLNKTMQAMNGLYDVINGILAGMKGIKGKNGNIIKVPAAITNKWH